jgi:hypothetical protein
MIKTMKNQGRQGDVFLERVASNAVGTVTQDSARERIVLAYGEATGHAHAIYEPGATLLESDEGTFLQVLKEGGVELEHEEHVNITVPEGTYKVIIQREWSLADEERPVVD